jgi:hypothetical protein
MSENIQILKNNLRQTMQLVRKSLYKTIEFQLLFKIFYLSFLIFILNLIIGIILDLINLTIRETLLNEVVQKIPLLDFFNVKIIIILSISLFIIVYVYLIEKSGVIIITSKYFQNNYIGFFETLFIALKRTPLFIFRRLKEMRLLILVLIGMYIFWKILGTFALPEWTMSLFAVILILLGAFIFFSILFRYTFTAYITCLKPNELPDDFNNKLPKKFLRQKTYVLIIFYSTLLISIIIWLLFFYFTTKILLYLVLIYPSFISFAIAFFVAFTIISILIILSALKTFKTSIMTTLYFDERKRQKKKITIYNNIKQPLLSKNIKKALLTITMIAFLGGILITTTIKTKTDTIIINTQEYINQAKANNKESFQNIENITLEDILKKSMTKDNSTLNTIENIIFTLFIYFTIK